MARRDQGASRLLVVLLSTLSAGLAAVAFVVHFGLLEVEEEAPTPLPLHVAERFVACLKAGETPVHRGAERMGYRDAYDLLATRWKNLTGWIGFYRGRVHEERKAGPIVATERIGEETIDARRRSTFRYRVERGDPYAAAALADVWFLDVIVAWEGEELVIADWDLVPHDVRHMR